MNRITWNEVGDPVLHIELRRWADILLIVSASANTIAKMSYGICDNLLLCVVRAWEKSRPLIICPAMNSIMLEHFSLSKHYEILKANNVIIIESEVKNLACGEKGNGALASVSKIVEVCREQYILHQSEWENDLTRISEKESSLIKIKSIQESYNKLQQQQQQQSTSVIPLSSCFNIIGGVIIGIFATLTFINLKFKLLTRYS